MGSQFWHAKRDNYSVILIGIISVILTCVTTVILTGVTTVMLKGGHNSGMLQKGLLYHTNRDHLCHTNKGHYCHTKKTLTTLKWSHLFHTSRDQHSVILKGAPLHCTNQAITLSWLKGKSLTLSDYYKIRQSFTVMVQLILFWSHNISTWQSTVIHEIYFAGTFKYFLGV